jgi:hypothetical protein
MRNTLLLIIGASSEQNQRELNDKLGGYAQEHSSIVKGA